MAPRPFPFALRVGTDIVSVERVHNLMTKKALGHPTAFQTLYTHPFLKKVLTHRELRFMARTYPQLKEGDETAMLRAAAHVAGRWAAKEAVIKACKPRKLTFQDVEILHHGQTMEHYALIRDTTYVWQKQVSKRSQLDKTEPAAGGDAAAAAEGDAAETTAAEGVKPTPEVNDFEGQIATISISHEQAGYATAVCIAPKGTTPGDVGGEAEARMYDEAAQKAE